VASGKSTVAGILTELGAVVIDADRLVREAQAPDTPVLRAIAARFGSEVVRPDGELDRARLAGIVFADEAARRDLEAIVHPEVYQRISEWFANLPPGSRVAIADIPLLFETGHQHDFDQVIVCACAPDEQVRRMTARSNLTETDARARLAAQWPTAAKVARADHVI
jgi:dephospho-CoA kinase